MCRQRTIARIMLVACLAVIAGSSRSAAAEPRKEADVLLFASGEQYKYRLPSLLVTSKGTVLAACQKRSGQGSDFSPSSLVLRRSRDGGKTFAPEQSLFARAGYCTFNGNLVEERQGGKLFACFIPFPQAERTTWFAKTWIPRGGGFSITTSIDDGHTWSAPTDIVPQPNADGWHGGGAFNNNHGVQIERGRHAGRLVIGARVFKTGVYEGRAKAGLIYSDDRGKTWRVGGVVLKDYGDVAGEVAVGETPDGEIYVNCRNAVSKVAAKADRGDESATLPAGLVPHRRIYARSRDGGETFYAEGCHAELYDEPCNAGLASYLPKPDGHGGLMLFTAPVGPHRTQLTGFLSGDGGRSWKRGSVIAEKAGGYSDIAVLPDGTILTLHEGPDGLHLVRYNLAWLEQGLAPRGP